MDQNNIEIPEYFLCPISLQIMKDPVTTVSGITYDRESIEQWLFVSKNATCPVTMHPLPGLSDLTPNHTLRRLIQAWCSLNAANRIPTPKPILTKSHIVKLVRDLCDHPNLQKKTLQKLEALAVENVRYRGFMVEADLATALTCFVVSCYERRCMDGVEEGLSLFYVVWKSKVLSCEKDDIIDALIWVCVSHDDKMVKFHAAYMTKLVIKNASTRFLGRLKPETFEKILSELRKLGSMCKKGVDCLLHVLLDACPWGMNRVVMVGSGAVSDMIEVEMRSSEKRTSELVLGVLYHLCSCEDGRAQLVGHPAGMVAVSRRLLEVSSMADERAVWIMWMISKYCGTNAVVEEMMRVGAVDKLCRVMVEDQCGLGVKEKAKEILRKHSHVWKLLA